MSRKKIIIMNHYGATPDSPGTTRHYELSKFLAKHSDYDIEFWLCGLNHYTNELDPRLKGIKLQLAEDTDGFKTVKIWSTQSKSGSIARQINIIIFDMITAFKILFSRNIACIVQSTPPVNILNILAAKLRNIKLVADVEDLWPLFLQDLGLTNPLAVGYMRSFSNFFYNKANAVSAVSNGMLNYVKDRIEEPKKMWLSPLGVNLEEFSNEKIDISLINDKEWKDDYKIMYLGAHGRANNLLSVIQTIELFNENYNLNSIGGKKVSFVFIGDGDHKDELVNYTRNRNIDNIYFEDAVPGRLVPEYLKLADICLTNLQKIESFKKVRPNKIFQYMALSKPIICGIWGEAEEIVEEANAGIYVDFEDHAKAAHSVYSLLLNGEFLSQAGSNGRAYIEQHGDRRKIFKEFKDHLEEIINRG